MRRVLFLCLCFVKRDTEGVELALLQYMQCVPALNAVRETLGCVRLPWATTEGRQDESEVGRSAKDSGCSVAREWFRAIVFQSMLSTAHVVWGNTTVHSFTTGLS